MGTVLSLHRVEQSEVAPAVHVNLSPVELHDPHFLSGVASILDRTRLDPGRLVLEITEGVVLRDPEKSIAILHRGSVAIQSEVGRGTRVRLTLPGVRDTPISLFAPPTSKNPNT